MDALHFVFSWGSPVGIASFFFLSGIGAGVFFWGLAQLAKSNKKE